ncbi:TetR/AcrR family transcriptional regulator [Cellulomonas bogoriensis]|uniref:TetR family transcriptional regulator n=1 Tax=Cellulomonas bogoriensis 69B4 = DSM 16987 TaxID=1386082 RepID=A0A0A0C0S5_9CELL|nr:TetR family transcriptional regulator [Cellulomonas bogoriensis]KGM13796.1 TetR family transcriptional regulator [Cellulomonas bogoriensis 69B4 = DSM 16987]
MSQVTPATEPDQDAVPTPDGRSARWDAHRNRRRTDLARAARKAVHRHGPEVSMDEIAATAGTSKSIVYRYFTDKAGLQRAVGELVVAQMHDELDRAVRAAGTPRDALRSMIDVYLGMVEHSPHVYHFVTSPVSQDASVPLGHFLDAVAGLIAEPVARVLGTGPAHPMGAEVWAAGAVGFVRGAGDWWLDHHDEPDAPTRTELAERLTTWLWAGPVSSFTRRDRTTPPSLDDEEQP